MASYRDIVPYGALFIDADWRHFFRAIQWSIISSHDREKLIYGIRSKWITVENPNPILPCLSVRTGFDLFLSAMNYPPGTEIIVSAVNIPDMIRVIHAHQLKVVAIDVDLETMAPKIHLLPALVSSRTKLLLVANVYGCQFDMNPVITVARAFNLLVIEDFAEGFGGFSYLGHSESDLALFSFGAIKFETAFGGAIAKIRDPVICAKMTELYETYPMQSQSEYLKKVIKYGFVYMILNCPRIIKPGLFVSQKLNIDHKNFAISLLRGFPTQLIQRLRYQPCNALLATMLLRFNQFKPGEHQLTKLKHEYVAERLPARAVHVGSKAAIRNHWLCPIVVEDPDEVVKALADLGVDAYRGATQLNVVESDNGKNDPIFSPLTNLENFVSEYPHEAKYLIDHVIYLPVNKLVPFHELDRICRALAEVLSAYNGVKDGTSIRSRLKLISKL